MNTPGESPQKDQWATKSGDAPRVAVAAAPDLPQEIGRYRIEKILGEGGFGRVYLAYDDQLNRPVAIKVPHPERVVRPEDAKAYLTEARVLASLDHPNIVPVYDVGTTPEGLCFVVSKLIEGSDLATRMGQGSLTHIQTAALIATVADGLHYAHRQGLVHRDIKPGNILIDTSGKAFVADFGLALREEDIGKGAKFSGTPSYMSPEQARGEGHRVDGRSDIFSLGVVFYELLTGRRPFHADSMDDLLDQITTLEARPLRQVDDAIPMELERICLKALSKRASERYMTAKDMADDLRHCLGQAPVGQGSAVRSDNPAFLPGTPPSGFHPTPMPLLTPPNTPIGPSSDNHPLKIVPKGLRSFDAHDADFFLELLPGPRDRDGLPDSIRFWKTRIEDTDPDNTFSVGLIYGPSGCGKSSLVKAGLLPRLSNDVLAVYVEATAGETEARLLSGLRKRCPALPAGLGLKETLAALRRGQGMPAGKKVLIVLDQFEQWLHALAGRERERPELDQTELVQALRQCDGGRVQCVVMVRDDFWMAATRFMRDLEVRLVEAQNSAAVDLFPVRHAEKVLAAFGRAFAVLPDSAKETGKEQKQFIEQAVAGLSQEGKVICVRLALFADMMKGRSWTPATLKEVGGTEGIGVTFLEETFSANSAPPEHRYHQKAARAVLKALLPESGTDIKGHMRSYGELLEASGYASRPKDFEDLIRVLDSEIRLITPTDPDEKDPGEPRGVSPRTSDARYYQLTHDYLVPSLRDWLTRKQKETRRGRAELLLADRAGVWNARPENRQLPSLWQWLSIRRLTRKKNWTPPQRKMMRKARRYHAVRGVALLVIVAIVGWGSFEGFGTLKAHALRDRLMNADTTYVPAIVADITLYHRWLDPLLREAQTGVEGESDSRSQLHASLALLPVDSGEVDYLYGRLLDAQPQEVAVIRDALLPHKDKLVDQLWAVVEQPAKGAESQRLRAASALAAYDSDSPRWDKISGPVVEQLVAENPVYLPLWIEGYRPVRLRLLPSLAAIFNDRKEERTPERTVATNILVDYAADQPRVLADLLMDADERQFPVLFPKVKAHGANGLALLQREAAKQLPPAAPDSAKETLAKRQANAAVALLKLEQADMVWKLLKHVPDPRARSYLIHRFGPLGAEPAAIVKRLDEESDPSIRRALILSLGEFTVAALSPAERNKVAAKLKEIYRTAADPGLHAAAEWLLRHWRHEDWLNQTNEGWRKDKEFREKQLADIRRALAKPRASNSANDPTANLRWCINGQGQTMVVIPGPVTFTMGSPETEDGRQANEPQHEKRISRTFALGAKAVTVAEFQRAFPTFRLPLGFSRVPDLPVLGTQWYQAAQYCNFLSRREGIPADQHCYEIDFAKGRVKLKANYLRLTGYRLPTEAEMEYATRAGAVTSRFYGESEELLTKYAWYVKNAQEQTGPVGSLKPNDFGLFDVHGNVFTWCQERYRDYPQPDGDTVFEDEEDDDLTVDNKVPRALRGGSFGTQKSVLRSALRHEAVPTSATADFGFRVARTVPLRLETSLPPPASTTAAVGARSN